MPLPDATGHEPTRDAVDALGGPTLLEFGAHWCGHCITAQPLIAAALAGHPQVRHIKVEDGPGRRLGRSYRVKLWPTLVFLRDGVEQARTVRPTDVEPIRSALARIDGATPAGAERPS
jgi:thioredoxin 1